MGILDYHTIILIGSSAPECVGCDQHVIDCVDFAQVLQSTPYMIGDVVTFLRATRAYHKIKIVKYI